MFAFLLNGPLFRDVTADLIPGLANEQACWIDFNGDGWTDLITGGVVWQNEKGLKFTKVQEGLGICISADFDNDGKPDLFSWSAQKLYRNEGSKFVEFALDGLPATVSRGACWADFDNDAYVDLFVGGFEDWDKGITYPSFVLHNEMGKGFKVVWTAASYRSRGVTAADYDRDGRPEVYASNYRLQPNNLYRFDADWKSSDLAPTAGAVATSAGFGGGHSIGAAWGDFDADGELDLFAGNFAHVDSRGDQPKSRFLRNLGVKESYRFEDKGECGVWYQESYASPAAGDVDNDGRLDLFFTTVYGTASFNKPNFPVLYRNGEPFKFTDETSLAGVGGLPPTYQAAFADFRNDGRLALSAGGKLFSNESPKAHWLEVRLQGDGKKVNRSAIGAQVRIKLKDRILTRQVEAGTGEGNQNDLKLHFGLGEMKGRVDLDILWPGGKRQTVRRVAIDRIVDVKFR